MPEIGRLETIAGRVSDPSVTHGPTEVRADVREERLGHGALISGRPRLCIQSSKQLGHARVLICTGARDLLEAAHHSGVPSVHSIDGTTAALSVDPDSTTQ